MPSTSRHHWGTDIDLNNLQNSYFEKGEGKKIFDWLVKNAFKYGFHMTYDNQEESKRTGYKMEKWHWSYMPISEQYLLQFNQYIKYEDICSFKGSKFACHEDIDIIKNIKTKTLIMTGSGDTGSTVQMSKSLSHDLKDSSFIEISDGKHLCSIECADDVNINLKNFINN